LYITNLPKTYPVTKYPHNAKPITNRPMTKIMYFSPNVAATMPVTFKILHTIMVVLRPNLPSKRQHHKSCPVVKRRPQSKSHHDVESRSVLYGYITFCFTSDDRFLKVTLKAIHYLGKI
jgi:hypothetical protein